MGICHINIASLSKHIDDLRLTLSLLKKEFQIIGISEHKIRKDLSPIINIDIEGYKPFLYDPTESSHGGTGFFIKETMNHIKRDDLKFNSRGNYESTFIEIIVPNKKNIVVGCIYRHPSSPISIKDFNTNIIEPLLNKIAHEDKLCALTGDFNIDLLKSDFQEDINIFFNTMTSHFFAPYIMQPTRPSSKSLIDNIFINSIEHNSHSGNITIQLSDHLFQFALLEGFFKYVYPKKVNIYERNFKIFNEREFLEELNSINWDDILCIDQNDPNLTINNFYENMVNLLDEHAPFKKLSKREVKLKTRPWINNVILYKMKIRDKLLLKYHKTKGISRNTIYDEYKSIRNSVTKLKRNAKKSYYKEYFQIHRVNSSSIWKGIKSIVKINNTIKRDITLINNQGNNISNPLIIANHFNDFFVNIGIEIDKSIPISTTNYDRYLNNIISNNSFFLKSTCPEEIGEIIKSLDTKKSSGPNSLPVRIVKLYNIFFSNNLSKIINLSFTTGIFPDLCKLAKVIPIFKKDNELLCENYRPISLLPIFSKIIEKIIYKQMYDYLTKNNLIYNKQFGFRGNHSTSHAVISLTESIKLNMDKGFYSAGVFIDLQKAFDTVNHKILSKKLFCYGFRGVSHNLLVSFLSNRKQFVSIQGFNSEILEVRCGVPQGSTLGPLLFLLYINDLRFCLDKVTSNHFADDTCLILNNNMKNNIKQLESILNKELKSVVVWLNANRLSLNVKKSKLLIFHSKWKKIDYKSLSIKLNDVILHPDTHIKHLGMIIDNHLLWDNHIYDLSIKLSRVNGIFAKLRHFVPKSILISVYYALFQSYMLYGCIIWSQSTANNINKIRVLQKKCLRIINFSNFNCHSNDLFKDCKILKIDNIIQNEKIIIAYQFRNNYLPIDLNILFERNLNQYNTRNMTNGGLVVPRINTVSYGERSLRFAIPKQWNNFITKVDINTMKSLNMLKKYLKQITLSSYSS